MKGNALVSVHRLLLKTIGDSHQTLVGFQHNTDSSFLSQLCPFRQKQTVSPPPPKKEGAHANTSLSFPDLNVWATVSYSFISPLIAQPVPPPTCLSGSLDISHEGWKSPCLNYGESLSDCEGHWSFQPSSENTGSAGVKIPAAPLALTWLSNWAWAGGSFLKTNSSSEQWNT